MVQILYFDYVAFVVLVIMLVSLVAKKTTKGGSNQAFLLMLLTTLYSTMYDICCVLLDRVQGSSILLGYIMNMGYLVLRNFLPVTYIVYIVTLTDTWQAFKKCRILSKIWVIPYIVTAILIISSPFTKCIFYISSYSSYARGPLFFILYVSVAFYVLFYLIYCLKYIKQITLKEFVPLISIIPLQLIALLVQFIYPNVLAEMLSSAACLLFVMLTIQRPDAMYDSVTGLFKKTKYIKTVKLICLNKNKVKLVFYTITNFQLLSSFIKYEQISSMISYVGSKLTEAAAKLDMSSSELFYLGNGRYAIVIRESDFKKTDECINLIKESISEEFILEDVSFSLPTNFCLINLPEDFNIYEELMAFDRDSYKFKEPGEIIYASEVIKSTNYRIIANIDTILDDAIRNKRFEVYYQPIFSTKHNRFNSCEALIRLNTEEYGFISPELFIPLAEENGLINKIDDIVFEEVCKFISSDAYRETGIDYIEVNLSVVQCMQSDLAGRILNTMAKYNIYPNQINLEITETAADYSHETIDKNIRILTEAGISLSLDDFGTGYSNMIRVASLPLHIVKLDKVFTFTENNPQLLLILHNTVDMIKKMNLKMVIEGVETKEKLEQFEALEIDYVQGYYFSKPLPKAQFVDFIKNNKLEG